MQVREDGQGRRATRAKRVAPVVTVLEELLDALESRVEQAAAEMAALIQEEFPLYRELDDLQEATWRAGLRETLSLFVRLQREDRGLDAREITFIEHIGESRADQRFPLDVVLGSVRLAMHVALGVVHQAAEDLKGVQRDEEVTKTFNVVSLRMTQFINAFSTAIGNGYFRRVEENVRILERNRARFVDDWLAGSFLSEDEVLAAAGPLGLDMTGGLGIVLVPSAGVNHLVVAKATSALAPVVVAPMASATVPHAVLVVRARTPNEWRSTQTELGAIACAHGVTLLVDGPCMGLLDVHERYVEASAMLQLLDIAKGHPGVLLARDLAPFHLVASGARTARTVVEREILAPLRARPNAEKLLLYLRAIHAHGSAKAAAAACQVDVRTVRAHKREIEDITGRSFDHAGDSLWLALAALICAL